MTVGGLVGTAAFVFVALGGYFAGGVVVNLASGDGVGRMFSGSVVEQVIQVVLALVAVWVGLAVVG